MQEKKQNILLSKRYWPSFWTQFFGAFNDNLFKNALVMLITYKAYSLGALNPEMMVALCGGIFILPYFLFSAIAGQISDKYPKDRLMFLIKIWEIIVMLVGAYGFLVEDIVTLLVTLFFMGLQSTFFGPVKYSILPEIIDEDELMQGNAYFEMGTFIAILGGTIAGGVLIEVEGTGKYLVAIGVLICASIGTLFSRQVTPLKAGAPGLKIDWGLIRPMRDIIALTKKNKKVFFSIMGISWFWFFGAVLLSMFPGYVKNIIGGDEHVVTLFIALFSIGIAMGSIACERFSRNGIEPGLVPLGSLGMSIFILDLYFVGTIAKPDSLIGILEFFKSLTHIRIVVDLLGLSIFAGFFTVPLYTIVQHDSEAKERSRVIAGLNIFNAAFMVVASLLLILLYRLNFSMAQIYGLMGIMNLVVAFYIYKKEPIFLTRFKALVQKNKS